MTSFVPAWASFWHAAPMLPRPSARTVRSAALVVVGAALPVIAACGTATHARPAAQTLAPAATSGAATPAPAPACGGFSLSLVSDRGGQSSPVAAAEWFSQHGVVPGVPQSGWQEEGEDESGVSVGSGDVTVHVVQGPDQTWQVDSGSTC